MRDSLLKTSSSPKELRDLRELKAYMLKEFPIGSRVRHTRGALGTVQSVDVTFPNIDESFPETHIWVKWDDGGTVDMIPASIDLVEEQQPLFTDAGKITTDSLSAAYANGYAKHAVAYLQKFGNTARCVKAWAFRNELDPYQLKEAVRAMFKCKNAAADLFSSEIAKVSSTKTAKDFIDDEWREILSTNGFYPSGAEEERWTKSGASYYVIIDHTPEGEPFYAVYESDDVLLEKNNDTNTLEIYISDREELQPVAPAPMGRGLSEEDIAELKRMGIKAKRQVKKTPIVSESNIYRFGGWITPKGKQLALEAFDDEHEGLAEEMGFNSNQEAREAGSVRVAIFLGTYHLEIDQMTSVARSRMREFLSGGPSKPVVIEWWNGSTTDSKSREFKNSGEALDWLEHRTVMASELLNKSAAMCECGHPFEIHTHPPDFGCPHENDPDGGCGCKGATEKTATSKWLYHVTFNGYLDDIARRGLVPGAEPGITGGGAKGQVFCSEAQHVSYWVDRAEQWAYHRADNPAEEGMIPVVIRFPRENAANLKDDEVAVKEDTGEGSYAADSVSPSHMEVWDGARWNHTMTVDPFFFVDKEGYIQDPKPKLAAGGTYYHATAAENIPSIAKTGLKPSEDPNWGGMLGQESLGKVYFTKTPEKAMFYAGIIFYQTLNDVQRASIPVCLRIRIPKKIEPTHAPKEYGQEIDEHWIQTGIPPKNIEVWWQSGWRPIQQVANWDWEGMEYSYDEEQGVFVDWEGAPVGETSVEADKDAKESFSPKTASSNGTLEQLAWKFRTEQEEWYEWEEDKMCFREQCYTIAPLLAKFLTEHGIPAKPFHGYYLTDGGEKRNHWWVVAGDRVVDVTADQFYPEDPDNYRVVVTSLDDPNYSYRTEKEAAFKDWIPGTVDENFKPHVSVSGIGRVGQPSRLRSRPHRYWVVDYFDGTRSETGYKQTVVEELGHFKTGREAARAAETFAKGRGWTLDDYAKSMLRPKGIGPVEWGRQLDKEKEAGRLNRALLPAALLALTPTMTDPAVEIRRPPIVQEKRVGLDELVDAIRRTEGADPALHNPGNLVGFHSGRIMRFRTETQGIYALKRALNRIADGQNPNFKPDMTLEQAGLVYSNGDPNWAKNIAGILQVDPKTPIGRLIKGMAKVGSHPIFRDMAHCPQCRTCLRHAAIFRLVEHLKADHHLREEAHAIATEALRRISEGRKRQSVTAGAWGERSYDNDSVHDILDRHRTPVREGGEGFEEPIPEEEVKKLLGEVDSLIRTSTTPDDKERYFGTMVFLVTHGAKLDAEHKQKTIATGGELFDDEDYLNRWKNPLIRKAMIEDELKLFED